MSKKQVRELQERFLTEQSLQLTQEEAKRLAEAEGIPLAPFNRTLKEFSFALRQKPLFLETLKAMEGVLYDLYNSKPIAETCMSLVLDVFESRTTSLVHSMKSSHYTKVMDGAIKELLELSSGDGELKIARVNG